jgi:hypothetical protein
VRARRLLAGALLAWVAAPGALALPGRDLAHAPGCALGAQTHFAKGWEPVDDIAARVAAGGFAFIRDEIYWDEVETVPGVFHFPARFDRFVGAAGTARLGVLAILDYGNALYGDGRFAPPRDPGAFGRFCGAAARHYGDAVGAWEIWNEANLARYWQPAADPAAYARLVLACGRALRGVRRDAHVVLGGTAGIDLGFLEATLRAGAGAVLDAVAVHPYRYPDPPEHPVLRQARSRAEEYAAIREALRRAGAGHLDLWVTEVGYPTVRGPRGVDEWRQAAYLAREVLLGCAHGVRRVAVFNFKDVPGNDPRNVEQHHGVVRGDLSAKPAYDVLARLATVLARELRPGPGHVGVQAEALGGRGPQVETVTLVDRDGHLLVAYWAVGSGAGQRAALRVEGWRVAGARLWRLGRRLHGPDAVVATETGGPALRLGDLPLSAIPAIVELEAGGALAAEARS